jgi:hypothetical protein
VTDYPQDVISQAGEVCRRLDIKSTVTNCLPIMDAILAERERCAQVAHEKLASWRLHKSAAFVAKVIRTPHSLSASQPLASDKPHGVSPSAPCGSPSSGAAQ